MTITLRPVEAADQPFLYRLYATTRADELAAWGWESVEGEAFLQLQFRAQAQRAALIGADHRLICQDEQPIGRLLTVEEADAISLADISLLPDQHNKGIGSALISQLIVQASLSGRVVRLHVEVNNRARHLYERLGFHLVAQHGLHYLMATMPLKLLVR